MTRINVMIVDDEERFLLTTSRLLEKSGFDVIKAASAIEAINLLKQFPVEVMVLDVKMPGMDGLEALKYIKQFNPLIQVIMLTGHATVESAAEGLSLEAFDYIVKPADIEELTAKIIDAYVTYIQVKEKQDLIQANLNMKRVNKDK